MALYQNPPPQPFIGGGQPLAPREFTPPSGVAAAQPPHRTLPETILAAWRVEPWPQQRTARLIQAAITAAANPSFDQAWLYAILNQWQVPAPVSQQRKLSPGIPGQSVDNPPNRAVDLRAALISYLADSYQPTAIRYARFTPGIDNPPFGLPARWRFDVPFTPAQVQYARFVQQAAVVTADNPPFGMPPGWLWGTLGQWQVIPPTPTRYQKLVQEFVAVVAEKTPFNQGWFWAVWNQWPATAPIIQQRKLSPGIPGQSVDNPPLLATSVLSTVKAWESPIVVPQRQIYQPQPFVTVQVNDPPFGMPPDWLYSVLTAAWKPGDPLPKQLQKILQGAPPPPVNDPPFGMPPLWLYIVLDLAWKPGDPLPKQLMKILQEGPPPPPDVTFRKIITLREDRIDVILG